jgi:O-antigen ligase
MFANLSISILYFFLFISKKQFLGYQKFLLIISLIWLVVYIYLLNSLTGFIILFALIFYSVLFTLKDKSRSASVVIGILSVFILMLMSLYMYRLFDTFSQTESIDLSMLEEKTKNGNLYQHDTISKRTENGYYINIYICRDELERSWEKKSKIPFDGKDLKGQEVAVTTIRYLSSKGLRKDSAGIVQLSSTDISSIENGCANYLYTNKYSFESRAYNIFWQLNTYQETGNSTAQSISQRIEFLKAAKILIKENFWFGVGTGDVMGSFKETLSNMKTKLDPSYYNRVHNQYIVELVALGIFGFLAFIFIILYPVFRFKIWKNYLFSSFYIIILISFFTDNPLETQLGVSFFSSFFCILVLDYLNSTLVNSN